MPSVPMFDLSTIDLSAVHMSADEVGKINPQSGPMRQLDHVIWIDDAGTICVGVKQITKDEFWAPHHIPGRPLMPGVLMIEAAAQLSSVLFFTRMGPRGFVGFARCTDAVFRHPVVPGDTLHLITRERDLRPRRFICEAQGMVGGEIAFEATLTGMVV